VACTAPSPSSDPLCWPFRSRQPALASTMTWLMAWADHLARIRLIHPLRGHLDEPPPGKFEEPAEREVHDDLVVLQSLAPLDRAQVPQEAVVTVAHSS
jgi:hypothetical protein